MAATSAEVTVTNDVVEVKATQQTTENESNEVVQEYEETNTVTVEEQNHTPVQTSQTEKTSEGTEKQTKSPKPPSVQVPCHTCGMTFNSPQQAEAHFSGKKHKASIEKKKGQSSSSAAHGAKKPFTQKRPRQMGKLQATFQQIDRERMNNIVCNLCNKGFLLSVEAIQHFNESIHQMKEAAIAEARRQEQFGGSGEMDNINLNQQLSCNICQISFNSVSQVYAHFTGKKHKSKEMSMSTLTPDQGAGTNRKRTASGNSGGTLPGQVAKKSNFEGNKLNNPGNLACGVTPVDAPREFYCNFCDVTVNSRAQLERHSSGIKHKLQTGELQEPPEWWIERERQRAAKEKVHKGQLLRCEICSVTVNSQEQLSIHMRGRTHRVNAQSFGIDKMMLQQGQSALYGQEGDLNNVKKAVGGVGGRGGPRQYGPDNSFASQPNDPGMPGPGIDQEPFSQASWQPPLRPGFPQPKQPLLPPQDISGFQPNRTGVPVGQPPNRGRFGNQDEFQDYDYTGQRPGAFGRPLDGGGALQTDPSVMMGPGMSEGVGGMPAAPLLPYGSGPNKNIGHGRGAVSSRGRGIYNSGYQPGWGAERRL